MATSILCILGTFLSSVECHFGIIRCIYDFRESGMILETVSCRAKRIKFGFHGILIIYCIQDTCDR